MVAGTYVPGVVRTEAPYQFDGAVTFTGSVTTFGHVVSSGTVPSAVAGANNGTTPPAPVINTSISTDTAGTMTFGSGASSAAGAQVVVTFSSPFGAVPIVSVTPGNSATASLTLYVSAVTATGFTLSTVSAPTASQANTIYSFNWITVG